MKKVSLLTLFLLGLVHFTFAQNTGTIRGRVYDALTNKPIEFATVTVQNTSFGANTDENGAYEIPNVPGGFYTIAASFLGYNTKTEAEIQVSGAKPAMVDFALEESTTEVEAVEIKAAPFVKTEESPLSLRTIGATEIQRNPGGDRDISKVIQSLPGVTSASSFRNDLLIRGGAPNENRFYLDDVEVPNINHFATQGASGGPVGLINVDFIREVNFYSGAFPANRGNALSSVFQFNQRNGRDDRLGGTVTLGSSNVAVSLEGPIGKNKKTTFFVSARQSYLQFLFKAIGLPFLPTYNDFQVKVRHQFDAKNEIYFLGLGAIDQFKLNLEANETEAQRYLLNNLPVSPQWNYTNGLVYKHYTDNGYMTFVLSRNMLNNEAYKYPNNDESLPRKLDYKSQEIENKLRAEHTFRTGKYKVNYGLAYEFVKYNNKTVSLVNTPNGPIAINYGTDINIQKYGLFAQVSRKLANDRLSLSLGLRLDGNSYSSEMSNPFKQVSPRFSASYNITDRLAINFNTGIFYQLPAYTILGYRENNELINKDRTTYIRNYHAVTGIEYNTATNTKFSIEGYFKYYENYPFLLREQIALANLGSNFGVIGTAPTQSSATGRTYGLEVMVQQRLYKGFYGILAYTLGKAEFKNATDEYKPSSWDSRHIVALTLGKTFKRNWEVGAKFRLQTGLPQTPFDYRSSSLQSNWDATGAGISDFTQLNTLRTGTGHQLDIRIDKKWYFKRWNLNLYLEIQNVYASSVGSTQLQQELDANGQPILENVGTAYPTYRLKYINDASGTRVPTLGVIVQF